MTPLTNETIQHLGFIQDAISRQASHAFAVKGWTISVSTALDAFILNQKNVVNPWLVFLPPIAFLILDSLFLRNERIFRHLYELTLGNDGKVNPFQMNLEFDSKKEKRSYWLRTFSSPSIYLIHGITLSAAIYTFMRS